MRPRRAPPIPKFARHALSIPRLEIIVSILPSPRGFRDAGARGGFGKRAAPNPCCSALVHANRWRVVAWKHAIHPRKDTHPARGPRRPLR